MVSKVYGKADGVDITFYHDHGDIWQIDVPWNDDGKYTAEIFAEDDGGNITFRCSTLFVISGHELQAVVMLNEMSAQVGCEKNKILHRDYRRAVCRICTGRRVSD